MMGEKRKILEELTAARLDYQRDMGWLRTRFGIIPKVHLSQVTGTFTTALNALESDTTEALESTLRSFRNLHREVMKEAVWSILEQTKNTLKMLQKSEPELFARKIKVWNRASWLFTNFSIKQSRTVGGNYRKALNLLAGL